MLLLEYEAKNILKQYRVAVPSSVLVDSSGNIPSLPTVLKSQVPVGGRGKAGGIQVVTVPGELKSTVQKLFALPISGLVPTTLLAEEVVAIDREFYLSLVINREKAFIELVAHTNGGMKVEDNNSSSFMRAELAEKTIHHVGEQLAEYYNLSEQTFTLQEMLKNLLICFIKNDVTLLEINPLVLTTQGVLVAGDCKMELDDTAAFRHPEWDFENKIADANFVTIDPNGTVATIANGAGLGMATVDAVADARLVPANFLDIGGGANSESVLAAFKKIMEYPNVQAIIINIFAGITKCDEVARAIITAKQQIANLPPLSIRLAGTNFEQAVAILSKEGISTFETLEECIATTKEIIHG